MTFNKPKLIVNKTKENETTEFIEKIFLKHFPNALHEEKPDVLVPVGGDGTILHTVKHYGHLGLPIFGIANGTVNFIPNKEDNWDKYFDDLKTGRRVIEEETTFLIKIEVLSANGEKREFNAVNDIVFGNGLMDYFHFILNSTDSAFIDKNISAGGLCISSPLGSTAYHYNNNGTIIISVNLPVFGLTTIVPNKKDKINRMLNANKIFSVKLAENQRDRCLLFIDGKTEIIPFGIGDTVTITKGNDIKFYFTNLTEFETKRLTY